MTEAVWPVEHPEVDDRTVPFAVEELLSAWRELGEDTPILVHVLDGTEEAA